MATIPNTPQLKGLQTFMKTLIQYLPQYARNVSYTDKAGVANASYRALDKATAAAAVTAAGGGYTSFKKMRDDFTYLAHQYAGSNGSDYNQVQLTKTFLRDFCDIDLDNKDTGAAIGYDANHWNDSQASVYTAENIMNETNQDVWYVPGSSLTKNGAWWSMETGTGVSVSTYRGVKLCLPNDTDNYKFNGKQSITRTYVYYPNGKMMRNSKNQGVLNTDYIRGLVYTDWMKDAVDLIYNTYGISFDDSTAGLHAIYIGFNNSAYDVNKGITYAYTGQIWNKDIPFEKDIGSYGNAIRIIINLDAYADFVKAGSSKDGESRIHYTDKNGRRQSFTNKLDRTFVHEMVHAAMLSNLTDSQHDYTNYMGYLPTYVKEGLAELVHGADDERGSGILSAIHTFDFDKAESSGDWNVNYGMSYAMLRYFMKQMRDPLNKVAAQEKVVLSDQFTGTLNLSDYGSDYRIIDASLNTHWISLNGTQANNRIYAGTGHNTIDTSTGNNAIYLNANGMARIKYTSSTYGANTVYNFVSGRNTFELGALRLNNYYTTSNGDAVLQCGDRNGTITIKGGAGKTFNVDSNLVDMNAGNQTVTLKSGFTGTENIWTLNGLYRIIDARQNGNRLTLIGNRSNNRIYAGTGHNTINASSGNNAIYLNTKGMARIKYTSNDYGANTVYNFVSGRNTFELGALRLNNYYTTSNGDAVLQCGDRNGTITIKGGAGKTFNVDSNLVDMNAGNQTVTLKSGFTGTENIWTLNGLYHIIDARANSNNLALIGTAGNDRIYAGRGNSTINASLGNDRIYLNAQGTSTILYQTGYGYDAVYDYNGKNAVLQFRDSSYRGYSVTQNNDVVVRYGNNESVTLKGAAGKVLKVRQPNGVTTSYQTHAYGTSYDRASKNSLAYLYDNNFVSASGAVGSLSATVQPQANRMMVAAAH